MCFHACICRCLCLAHVYVDVGAPAIVDFSPWHVFRQAVSLVEELRDSKVLLRGPNLWESVYWTPSDRRNKRILPNTISGRPFMLGLGPVNVRSLCLCGCLGFSIVYLCAWVFWMLELGSPGIKYIV